MKLKDNINSYTDFKLLLPNTRKAENELFISTILNNLNFLTPQIYFTEIEMFEQKNEYLFYENLNKEFLERNNKVEGPIIRGDERFFFKDEKNKLVFARLENSNWIKDNKKNQIERSVEALTLANRIFISNAIDIKVASDDFLKFNYNTIKEFTNSKDIKKFRLLINALGASNSLMVNDLRMYYDPIFKKLELIFNDGSSTFLGSPERINYSYINFEETDIIDDLILNINKLDLDKIKKDLYNKGLDISDNKLLDNIFKIKNRLENIRINKPNLKKSENVQYSDDDIRNIFNDKNLIYSFYIKDNLFEFCQNLKCENHELSLKDIKKLLNQRYEKYKKKVIFIGYKNFNKKIINFLDKSKWNVQKIGDTKIYYSKEAKIEILDNKINIVSKRNSKVIFTGGTLENVKVNYSNEKPLTSKNFSNLNGCINFYDIRLIKIKIDIKDSFCEDSINFVRVQGDIDEINSYNSFSDGIDFDFSNLRVRKIIVKKSKNDCLDFSFGNYILEYVEVYNCGDKAFSIGENSKVKINKAYSSNSNINIAVKDKSNVYINDMTSKEANYCVAMYRKKSEFIGSKLNISNLNCENQDILIDPGNLFSKNDF